MSSRKWDQPPLVPPVEEGGPQVHVGKEGGRGWEKGVGGKEGQEGREEGGRGLGNPGHRQIKKAGRETRHTGPGNGGQGEQLHRNRVNQYGQLGALQKAYGKGRVNGQRWDLGGGSEEHERVRWWWERGNKLENRVDQNGQRGIQH